MTGGNSLVSKMPHACEHHGNTSLIGCCNNFSVSHGAARLNHTASALIHHHIQAISEGEKGVAGYHCIFE
jgi:hypothetical protein